MADRHATLQDGELRTRHLPGGRAPWAIALPRGLRAGEPVDVVVSLPGRGGTARDPIERTRLPDQLAAHGVRAAVAGLDGTDAHWHPRADGRDPLATLLDEFLPLLEDRFGMRRLVLHGVSMGGYGAALAGQTRPRAVTGLVVSSGATWLRHADAVADAFDSDADFTRHDVVAGAGRLHGVPVRVDCGTGDPFLSGDRAFAAAARRSTHVQARFADGCHDGDFWANAAVRQAAWIGQVLQRA